MPLLRPEATQYSQSAARQTIERYEPSLYESFATGFGEGLQYTSFGMAGRMTQWYRAGIDSEPIEENAWKESKHFREGLKYFTGMTQDRAAILAYRHDIQAHRDFVRQHQKGFLSKATGFMGSLAGNIPDPINYIPYVRGAASLYLIGRGIKTAEQMAAAGKIARTASRLKAATWTGSIAKSAAVSSAEAVAGTAVLQPLFIAEGRQSQIEYNYVNVLEQLGFAGVIGAGFGGLSAILKHVPAEVHEKGFVKTLDDVTAESPRTPDVAPVIKQDIEDAVTKIETRIDELKSQKVQKETIVKQLEELKIQKLETELAEKALKEGVFAQKETKAINAKIVELEKTLEGITKAETAPGIPKPPSTETGIDKAASAIKLKSEDAQKAIDDFTDVLVAKYGKEEALYAPVYPEDYIKMDLKVPETKLSDEELSQLRDLYKTRDAIDKKDLSDFFSEIERQSGLSKKETHDILKQLGMDKESQLSVTFTSKYLQDWQKDILDNLETLYNHFAQSDIPYEGTYARFLWGGTGENPTLIGQVFDEDVRPSNWNIEALKKAQDFYNVIAKTQDLEQIDLLKNITQNKKQLVTTKNREITLDYSTVEPEKPLEIPPPPKESAVKGLDDINEQIESLKTDMQDLESRELLTPENKKALADADKAVKDVALWKKAIRMAKDCIMGEQD